MDNNETIDISSGESDAEPFIDRRPILQPVISRVVAALGGYEPGGAYRMGDEVSGCLKDLKKLWRKDDTDDELTVARIYWETRVLPNDLIPILLATAGAGLVEDKRAIACADLMTAMTWPIDMAEELKELDDELDKGTDYTQLIESHLYYKAALLKPGVIEALFGIMVPPLAKPMKKRQERDGQIINVVLHLIRNLAFIKDLPFNTHLSSDQAEFSSLQSKLIRALSETRTLQLLLTIAANATNDPLLNSWNTLVLEIFYLLFRGIKPSNLTMDQTKQPTATLHRLLAAEEHTKRELARKATSRHSRFGTTIAVKLNTNKKPKPTDDTNNGNEADMEAAPGSSRSFVLHRQQAIIGEAGSIMDMTKRQVGKKNNKIDEMMREDNLSLEARVILRGLATEFIEACFNPFLAALLKDIRSERAKITEKDNLRLLFVTKWFLEYFLCMRKKENTTEKGEKWQFGLIAEVTERAWIVWVLKRMREAVEEKPKQWTELQTGIQCLTQLILLIDIMSSSDITDPVLKEAADILQQQLIYNGEVLDIAFESLRSYKTGTQSLAYLDSSVHLAYALLKMLERWAKSRGGDVYVRKKKAKKRRNHKGISEEDGIQDVEVAVEEQEEVIHETMFTFEAFEMKFAHADITHTLLTYLARYKDFTSSESMRRVVSLMHRQAVRAKAEGLFFKVSTLDLFKTILANQKSLPREQPYKDLLSLITFILRQFFKALAEEPFLAIEAFYPKNRGHWRQFSSWEPEKKSKRERKAAADTQFPQEVEVKKGYSWSDQLGIAIASLVEAGREELVLWTKDILTSIIEQRQRIINSTDAKDEDELLNNEDSETVTTPRLDEPSTDALAKITDYLIPYLSDEQADAATKNPQLKLLFRLVKFSILDEDAEELEWYIPAGLVPSDLQRLLTVIDQFLETPFDLSGKKAAQLLTKRRRRKRRRLSPSSDDDNDDDNVLEDEEPKKKKEKKKKEKEQYKSAQFIEDSDEEYGDMEVFLEKEKAMREKVRLAAAAAGKGQIGTMKPNGTKKRRKKVGDGSSGNKKHKGDRPRDSIEHDTSAEDPTSLSNDSESDTIPTRTDNNTPQKPPLSRPRPRPIVNRAPPSRLISSPSHSPIPSNAPLMDDAADDDKRNLTPERYEIKGNGNLRRNRLVISDEDD